MGHARQSHRNITAILATLSRPCTRLSWTTLLDRRMDVLASRSWSIARPRKCEASSIFGRHHAADTLWDTDRKSGSGSSGCFPCIRRRSTCPGVPNQKRALRRRGPMATKTHEAQSLPPSTRRSRRVVARRQRADRFKEDGTDGAPVRQCLRLLFQSQDDADDLGAHIGTGCSQALGEIRSASLEQARGRWGTDR